MVADFTGNVVIVTGSASGMGLATATTLACRGAQVALWDVNRSGLEEVVETLKAQHPDKVFGQVVDVTDRQAVKAALVTAQRHFGAVHSIANFAGTGGQKLGVEPVWETSSEEFDFIFNLNVKGLFNILGESLAPGFLKDLKSIVHIASMFSERGYQNGAAFSASKHAAVGMVKSSALEAGPRNIRINCLLPYVQKLSMHFTLTNNVS